MAINKVVRKTANGEETLIDLTKDTVEPWKLAKGITAHDKSGVAITGTMDILGYVETGNNLFLLGDIPSGNYSVKYEKDDGKIITIGELVISSYTNVIDTVGYDDNTRISTSSGGTKTQTGYVTTKFIDLTNHNFPITIRTSGVNFTYSKYPYSSFGAYKADETTIGAYLSNFAGGNGITVAVDANGNLTLTITNTSIAKVKLCGYGSGANLIVTVNEEIT